MGDNTASSDEPQQDGGPLYEGSAVSVLLYQTMLMLFVLRHKLSYQGLKDLFQLIAFLCPAPNRCYSTVYQMKKMFSDKLGMETPKPVKICKRCLERVSTESSRCGRNARCKRAGVFEYFIFDIKSQLQSLLQGK